MAASLQRYIDKTGKEVVPPATYTKNGAEYFISQAIQNTAPSFSDSYALVQRFFVNGVPENVNPRFYFALTVDAEVSGWAREQVDSAAVKGGNKFDPTGDASIEQAMVIALRMFENLK